METSGAGASESFVIVNGAEGLEDAAGVALHERAPAHLARQQQVLPAQRVQVLHLQGQDVSAPRPQAPQAPRKHRAFPKESRAGRF